MDLTMGEDASKGQLDSGAQTPFEAFIDNPRFAYRLVGPPTLVWALDSRAAIRTCSTAPGSTSS